jgi:hypothetical protein
MFVLMPSNVGTFDYVLYVKLEKALHIYMQTSFHLLPAQSSSSQLQPGSGTEFINIMFKFTSTLTTLPTLNTLNSSASSQTPYPAL